MSDTANGRGNTRIFYCGGDMVTSDYQYKNGRFDLPASARGVYFVPIEHRDGGPRPVAVRSVEEAKSRRFTSFFRNRRHSAR